MPSVCMKKIMEFCGNTLTPMVTPKSEEAEDLWSLQLSLSITMNMVTFGISTKTDQLNLKLN